MYYLKKMCCSCLSQTEKQLRSFKCLNEALMDFYNFFITKVYTVSELNTSSYFICDNCLNKLKECYQFWTQCIKSKNTLYSYTYDLKSTGKTKNHIESSVAIILNDVKYRKPEETSLQLESVQENKKSNEEINKEPADSNIIEINDESSYKFHIVKETNSIKDDLTIAVLGDEEENKFIQLVDNFSHLVDELEKNEMIFNNLDVVNKNTVSPDIINENRNRFEDDDYEDDYAMYIDVPEEEEEEEIIERKDNDEMTIECDTIHNKEQNKDPATIFYNIVPVTNDNKTVTNQITSTKTKSGKKRTKPNPSSNTSLISKTNRIQQKRSSKDDPELQKQTHACTECSAEFSAHYQLERHALIHSDGKLFRCPYCNRQFRVKKYVLIHESHYLSGKFKCELCNKVMCSVKNLSKHNKIHNVTKKKITCSICGKNLPSDSTLSKHIIKRHPLTSEDIYNSIENSIQNTLEVDMKIDIKEEMIVCQ